MRLRCGQPLAGRAAAAHGGSDGVQCRLVTEGDLSSHVQQAPPALVFEGAPEARAPAAPSRRGAARDSRDGRYARLPLDPAPAWPTSAPASSTTTDQPASLQGPGGRQPQDARADDDTAANGGHADESYERRCNASGAAIPAVTSGVTVLAVRSPAVTSRTDVSTHPTDEPPAPPLEADLADEGEGPPDSEEAPISEGWEPQRSAPRRPSLVRCAASAFHLTAIVGIRGARGGPVVARVVRPSGLQPHLRLR